MTVLADVTRICRRPGKGAVWQCFWCFAHIQKGDVYREQRYVGEGTINTVRGHPECFDACDRADRDPDEPIINPQPRGLTQEEYAARALFTASPEDFGAAPVRAAIRQGVQEGLEPLREMKESLTKSYTMAKDLAEKLKC